MKNNSVFFDSQIIIANLTPDDLDENLKQKNISLFNENFGCNKFINLNVLSEVIWLIFRKTYRGLSQNQSKKITAKESFKNMEIRKLVNDNFWVPLIQTLISMDIKLFEEVDYFDFLKAIVESGIDGTDYSIKLFCKKHNLILVTGDDALKTIVI